MRATPSRATRWALAWVLASGLAGCGGCDEGGSSTAPDVEWLSDGAGEPNGAPLFPLRAGLVAGSLTSSITTDATVSTASGPLLRMTFETRPVNLHAVIRRAWLLDRGARGVQLHGEEQAPWPRPILLVPDTVRVGMRWRNRVPGLPDTLLAVIAREEVVTTFGPGVMWSIAEVDANGTPIDSGAYELLEGFGPLRIAGEFGGAPIALPLDGALADAPAAPDLAPTPPQPYGIGTRTFGDNLIPVSLGAVIPATGAPGTLIVKGYRSCSDTRENFICREARCFDLYRSSAELTYDAQRVELWHRGRECVLHRQASGPTAETGTLVMTSDASGANVLPGDISWVPRTWQGTGVTAPYADPATREFRMIFGAGGPPHVNARAAWTDILYENPTFPELTEPLVGEWISPVLHDAVIAGEVPNRTATLSAPGAPVDFALQSQTAALFHSTLTGDELSAPRLVATISGSTTVSANAQGHRLLAASPGGRIDRIVRDAAGTLAREAIARVALPAGERVVAALDLEGISDDRVVIATHRFPTDEEQANPQGSFGALALYSVTRQPPRRWAWPGTARAARRINDVSVCWPPTSAPFDPTGWTLAGAAPKQVLETVPGECALIVRDVDADPMLQGRSLATLTPNEADALQRALRFDVEGPVPGVGRMRLAPGESTLGTASSVSDLGLAPLSGGGFASTVSVHGAGGVRRAIARHASDATGLGVVDLTGAGMWSTGRGSLNEHTHAFLINATGREIALPAPTRHNGLRFADPNGGVILGLNDGTQVHVSPGGTVTTLPAGAWGARRRTGELCRLEGGDAVCANATTGAETARATVPHSPQGMRVVLPDDSLLISVIAPGAYHVYRWVPGSAPTLYAPRMLWSSSTGPDGTVYCVLRDDGAGDPDHRGGRCAPTGFEDLNLNDYLDKHSYLAATLYRTIDLITAGPHELWVQSRGLSSATVTRIPLPL